MGLLDALLTGKWSNDPDQNAAMQQGLLQFGLNLMSRPGGLAQAIGQSGLSAMQGVNDFRDRQYQARLQREQLADIERRRRMQAQEDALLQLPGKYVRPGMAGVDATGGAETAAENPANFVPPKMDLEGLAQAYMAAPGGFRQGLDLQSAIRKQGPTFHSVAKGAALVGTDPSTGRPVSVFQQPDTENSSPLARLLDEQRQHPPGSPTWKAYQDAIQKATTHQPGVSVSYGAPVAGVDPKTNEPIFFQSGKTGGPPAIVPGVVPPDKTKDPTEFQSKAKLYYESMSNASQVLNRFETSGRKDWMQTAHEAGLGSDRPLVTPLMSTARQKYVQAQRQWIDSINRVRSGANLPEIEYARAVRTFFPTFGESDASVIDQKRHMRALEEKNMKDAAGRAAKSGGSGGNVLRFNERGEPVN